MTGDPEPPVARPEPGDRPAELREQFRSQLITGLGGWTGMLITAIPTVVFVVVNAITTLRAALISAVAAAIALSLYRLVRRQPVQQALSGLFGVLIAAVIAARTGQARGYFLVGIWSSVLYGAVFLGSLVVRRPLIGVVWEFVDPTPAVDGDERRWWHKRPLLAAYSWATAAATVVFASRAIVQGTLFHERSTGWLAVARIAMGYPLTAAALAFAFWIIRRARRRMATSFA